MKTIIVTVRHPDYENEHHTFGEAVVSIDIDLGSSFDASRLGPDDWDNVLEWACGLYDEADEIEKDSIEAADFIRATAEENLALCLPTTAETCRVEPYIRRARRLVAREA